MANSRLGQAVPQSSLLPPSFSTLIGSHHGSDSFVESGALYRQTRTRRFSQIRRGNHFALLAGAMLVESDHTSRLTASPTQFASLMFPQSPRDIFAIRLRADGRTVGRLAVLGLLARLLAPTACWILAVTCSVNAHGDHDRPKPAAV